MVDHLPPAEPRALAPTAPAEPSGPAEPEVLESRPIGVPPGAAPGAPGGRRPGAGRPGGRPRPGPLAALAGLLAVPSVVLGLLGLAAAVSGFLSLTAGWPLLASVLVLLACFLFLGPVFVPLVCPFLAVYGMHAAWGWPLWLAVLLNAIPVAGAALRLLLSAAGVGALLALTPFALFRALRARGR